MGIFLKTKVSLFVNFQYFPSQFFEHFSSRAILHGFSWQIPRKIVIRYENWNSAPSNASPFFQDYEDLVVEEASKVKGLSKEKALKKNRDEQVPML
jgi:hypothetical protein